MAYTPRELKKCLKVDPLGLLPNLSKHTPTHDKDFYFKLVNKFIKKALESGPPSINELSDFKDIEYWYREDKRKLCIDIMKFIFDKYEEEMAFVMLKAERDLSYYIPARDAPADDEPMFSVTAGTGVGIPANVTGCLLTIEKKLRVDLTVNNIAATVNIDLDRLVNKLGYSLHHNGVTAATHHMHIEG